MEILNDIKFENRGIVRHNYEGCIVLPSNEAEFRKVLVVSRIKSVKILSLKDNLKHIAL